MLVHLRRRDGGHNDLRIARTETHFGNWAHAGEIREALEKLLQVPGMIQLIQEDQGLQIVWDSAADPKIVTYDFTK